MAGLLDIFGFLSVLLRAATLSLQSLVLGGIVFGILILRDAHLPAGSAAGRLTARFIAWCAGFLAFFQLGYVATDSAILMGTANLGFADVAGATFFVWSCTSALAALAVLFFCVRWSPARIKLALLPAAVILASSVATSHAAARMEDRVTLLILTTVHQGAAAAWIGGLPYLFLTMSRSPQALSRVTVARFSRLAQISVAGLVLAGAGLSYFYVGSVSAIYGTSYGLMVAAKVILLGMLLLLGGANFLLARQVQRGETTLLDRLRRFSEAEIGIGFTVILAAASLTSQPPAVDLTTDRASAAEVMARMAPRIPRLETPPLSSLSPPTQLTFTNDTAPESFVPGVSYQPSTPGDIAWSEYNHHWSGLVVLVMGLLAVLSRFSWGRWARHWPLAFVGLAVFLLLRADPENWPLGPRGFWESFSVSEVAQHRLFVLLILLFAAFEWGVQTGRLRSQWAALVFPAVCAAGGAALMTHSHSLSNIKEATLIEMTHVPLAILAVCAGWARWLEIRSPNTYFRLTSRLWPVCFVLIGALLLLYRES